MNEARLIDANALKKAFEAWKTTDDYHHDTDCIDIPFSEAFDLIDNAPTVEQPQGEWITIDRNDKFKTGYYKCNLCGYKNPVPDELAKNFCPNCGARMANTKGGECMEEVRKLLDKTMEIDKVIKILDELWRYKETDKFSEEEIRIAIETAISYLAVIRKDNSIQQN